MGKNSTSKDTVKRPWCAITDMDQYLFGEGTHYELYKKLGAHPAEYEGEQGVYFAVWAPACKRCQSHWRIQSAGGSDEYPHEPAGAVGNLMKHFVPGRGKAACINI